MTIPWASRSYRPPIKNFTPGGGHRWNFTQVKRDGHYLRVELGPDPGRVMCWTKQPTDVTRQVVAKASCHDILQPVRWHESRGLYEVYTVVGELFYPGKPASYVKSGLARGEEPRFEAFAILRCPQASPSESALWDIDKVNGTLHYLGFATTPAIKFGFEDPLSFYYWHRDNTPEGAEGLVYKQSNLFGWAKWKPMRTVDCVITGYTPGEGKYADQIGSILVSLNVDGQYVEIAAVSGMTDTQRQYITGYQAALLGEVVEVSYQLVGSQGRLRHPQFVRFREDKRPDECTMEQLQ